MIVAETMHDKEARRLQRANITLMRNPKFALYSGILAMGRIYVDESTPTARTDGRDTWFGRAFIKRLNDKELCFVVLHEALHRLYMHLTMWRKLWDIDPMCANMACDYVINAELRMYDPAQNFIAMPKEGLLDLQFHGMTSKQVFDLLRKNGKSGNKSQPGQPGNQPGQPGQPGGFDEHDWEGAEKMTDKEKETLAKEINSALRQGIIAAKKVGEGAGGLSREAGELMEPVVDWREVLREFVKSYCNNKDKSSWRRVNRRFLAQDVYMPSLIGEAVGRMGVGIDTSGSISSELTNFLSELRSIAEDVQPELIDLVYWDSAIASHEQYDRSMMSSLVHSTKPKGGGGTSPSCVTDWLATEKIVPECFIMFTDGWVGSDWGHNWPCPVLWVVVNNKSASASTGITVHI